MAEDEKREFQTLSHRREEEEYFFKQDQELVARLRERLNKERQEKRLDQEQQLHWMRCPKCGGQLLEKAQDKVMVEMCERCGGLFLDKGELDLILKMRKPETFLDRLSQRVDRFFTQGFDIDRPEKK